MHTFYKEHDGSYAVAIPWVVTDGVGGHYNDWHNLFKGLTLQLAVMTVVFLNGGAKLSYEEWQIVKECAA